MNEWISVKTRLPDFHKDVLVYGHSLIAIGYHDGAWWRINVDAYTDESILKHRDIIHWMSLPSPPND